jgi:hypothetical protein
MQSARNFSLGWSARDETPAFTFQHQAGEHAGRISAGIDAYPNLPNLRFFNRRVPTYLLSGWQ